MSKNPNKLKQYNTITAITFHVINLIWFRQAHCNCNCGAFVARLTSRDSRKSWAKLEGFWLCGSTVSECHFKYAKTAQKIQLAGRRRHRLPAQILLGYRGYQARAARDTILYYMYGASRISYLRLCISKATVKWLNWQFGRRWSRGCSWVSLLEMGNWVRQCTGWLCLLQVRP